MDKCSYTHALQPGYVIKREVPTFDPDADPDVRTLEEIIEDERAALPSDTLTPVTFESFMEWKKKKLEEKEAGRKKKMEEEMKKAGSKIKNIMSGRALFALDPTVFLDDEDAYDADYYEIQEEEETKEEETAKQANKLYGDDDDTKAKVDTDLFAQEAADGVEEEEPDFDD
jgi:hypothetical protein